MITITELDAQSRQIQYRVDERFAGLLLRFMSLKRDCPVDTALKALRRHFPSQVAAVKRKKLPIRRDGLYITSGTTVFHPLRLDHNEGTPNLDQP
jgi:hypothetical protein